MPQFGQKLKFAWISALQTGQIILSTHLASHNNVIKSKALYFPSSYVILYPVTSEIPSRQYIERNGPQGSLDEGAYEDGKDLTVIGKQLNIGQLIPDFTLIEVNANGADRTRTWQTMPEKFILYPVNSFLTPVCNTEAEQCEELTQSLGMEPDTADFTLFGVSTDSVEDLSKWIKTSGRKNLFLRVPSDTFGKNFGIHIKEYDGQLQRSLFALRKKDDRQFLVADAQYIYDQGGPIPDFHRGIAALKNIF